MELFCPSAIFNFRLCRGDVDAAAVAAAAALSCRLQFHDRDHHHPLQEATPRVLIRFQTRPEEDPTFRLHHDSIVKIVLLFTAMTARDILATSSGHQHNMAFPPYQHPCPGRQFIH